MQKFIISMNTNFYKLMLRTKLFQVSALLLKTWNIISEDQKNIKLLREPLKKEMRKRFAKCYFWSIEF